MLPVSGCGNYILIPLQVLNVDDFEESKLSTKFREETRGDVKKNNGMCRTLKLPKLLENVALLPL